MSEGYSASHMTPNRKTPQGGGGVIRAAGVDKDKAADVALALVAEMWKVSACSVSDTALLPPTLLDGRGK